MENLQNFMENLPWISKLDAIELWISGIVSVALVVFYICLTLWGKWELRQIRKDEKSSPKNRS